MKIQGRNDILKSLRSTELPVSVPPLAQSASSLCLSLSLSARRGGRGGALVPPPSPPGPLQSSLLTSQPRTRPRLPARLPPGYSGAIRRPARGCGGRAAGSGLPKPVSVPAGPHGARAPSLSVHAHEKRMHQPLQQPVPGRSRAAFQNGRVTPLRSRLPTSQPRASPASYPTSASSCGALQGSNSKHACAGVAVAEAPIPPKLISSTRFPAHRREEERRSRPFP